MRLERRQYIFEYFSQQNQNAFYLVKEVKSGKGEIEVYACVSFQVTL